MKTILQKQYHEHTEKIISAFQKAYPDKKIIDVLSIDTIFRPLSKDYLLSLIHIWHRYFN